MAARKMHGSFRTPKFMHYFRQIAADESEDICLFNLRAKLRNCPTDREDIHHKNVRKLYEIKGDEYSPHNFDSTDKIRRLTQRRKARKLTLACL
jgi:hypothetical protein